MSLYVRVELAFYTHRKTMRLRAVIGDDAFWVPPRLWAYAAGNQPDGCFKDYTAEEIASLIGYSHDAKRMLEALLKAGFMEEPPLRIHDWHEYNGILDFYSKRAKKAADTRWERERAKEKGRTTEDQSRSDHSRAYPSIASSIGGMTPEWEAAKRWLTDWNNNGADYTEAETRGAFLALQAGGWKWGKNPIADHRAALERQIQTDRDRKQPRNGDTRQKHHITGQRI